MTLSARRARGLLKAMQGRRVLVVGDVMLDEFLWGRVMRISPEAPVPVVEITRETFHLGGAANVAGNVRSLGGRAVVAGVVGSDLAGSRVRQAVAEAGIGDALTESGGARPTTLKTRIIAHHQQVVRADREQAEDLSDELEAAVLREVARHLPGSDAVIVSDYHKGVVTPNLMAAIRNRARRRRLPVLIDPKVGHFGLYRGASLVKPNQSTAEEATGIRIRSGADLQRAGEKLLRTLRCGAVLITRGEQGMSLFEAGRPPVHVPTQAREVFDVTGAGDTVIAALGLALAAGASAEEAARLANFAAEVVVGKLGTATAAPDEVLSAIERTTP